jgi:hypothetical protein
MQPLHLTTIDPAPDNPHVEPGSPSGGWVVAAIITGVVIQYLWAFICISQLKEPLLQICTGTCDPQEHRLHDSLLLLSIPIVAPLLSVISAAFFGFSLRSSKTWFVFLIGVPILAIFGYVGLLFFAIAFS